MSISHAWLELQLEHTISNKLHSIYLFISIKATLSHVHVHIQDDAKKKLYMNRLLRIGYWGVADKLFGHMEFIDLVSSFNAAHTQHQTQTLNNNFTIWFITRFIWMSIQINHLILRAHGCMNSSYPKILSFFLSFVHSFLFWYLFVAFPFGSDWMIFEAASASYHFLIASDVDFSGFS